MNILQFLIDIRSKDNGVISQVTRLQDRLNDADRSANRLSSTIGGKLRTAIMSLPGAEFFTNPIVALTAGIGVVSKLGMDADRTAVSFEVMLGSQQKAADMLNQMNRYAADSPYSRLGVQEAAQTMLGFGVEQQKVIPSLKMLGDIAMGNSERFKGLALVFSQVAAAGKLQGQDLLQLITNGYNPLNDISRLTGKSMSELKDDMSKGNISFDLMAQAMQAATSQGGKFYGMVDRIAQTPFGRFGQLVDQFKDTMLSLYKVIEPLLIPAFDLLSNIMTHSLPVIEGMQKGVRWLIDNFKTLAPYIYTAAAALAGYNTYMFISTTILKGWTVAQWAQVTAMIAAEKVQWLLNVAMSANPIGLVIAAVAALTAGVIYCWNKFAGFRAVVLTVWDTITGFGKAIKDAVVDRFWEIVDGIGAVGKAMVSLIKGDFEGAWQQAQTGAKKLVGVESAQRFVGSASAVVNKTGTLYQQHLSRETAKQKAKDAAIGDSKAVAGTTTGNVPFGTSTQTDASGKANEITTGGTRNTQITVNITKFFDYLNVTMMDKADTAEIQRVVLECINRSIEISMSAAR
jgi:tape measure domain-containing protein|nr:MAG TPA: tail tape measure protein [Caudoviricetes sp.]